ncbi:hypothetical protein D3C84_922480 [compost metagenome]
MPVGGGHGAGGIGVIKTFGTLRLFVHISKFTGMLPVKCPKLAQISVFVLVVLRLVGGITANVAIHPIRASDQQPGHAFVHRGDDMAVLQPRGASHA